MLNKKQRPNTVSNRIDRLFADLGQEAAAFSSLPIETQPEAVPGQAKPALVSWKWACDSQGNYIEIGSDVSTGLGRPAAEFTGQPLSKYGLTADSQRRMRAAMHRPDLPLELDVEYLDKDGNSVPVRMYIISAPQAGEESEDGWRGYAQQLTGGLSHPAAKPRISEAPVRRPKAAGIKPQSQSGPKQVEIK